MSQAGLYLVPSTVKASSWAVPEEEALKLGILCLRHNNAVHAPWGNTHVCLKCKESLYTREEGEWVNYSQQFEKLLSEYCSVFIQEILGGFPTPDARYYWLVDILATLCVIKEIRPAEALKNFTNHLDWIENSFSQSPPT